MVAGALALGACGGTGAGADRVTRPPPLALSDSLFAALVDSLSEPGGFFDTDNLISNERSYLHPVGLLRSAGFRGGAYLGVGPDQNFSYIVHARPDVAFIIDIRRDNLLQQLLFKALFALARDRVEYLSLLHGRSPPPDLSGWEARSVEEVVAWVDAAPPDSAAAALARTRVDSVLDGLAIRLSDADRATIDRFHRAFIDAGPDLRFTTFGREPRPYYPTYRQLLLEQDLEGRPASYLVREEDFRFLKELEARGRVIPIVGDLAGTKAMRAIGDLLRGWGEEVTVFYTSNVEFYLMEDGTFPAFAANVQSLPIAPGGVIVRSYFPNFGQLHPHAVPGYYSTQTVQPLSRFGDAVDAGGFTSYWDLVTRDALDLRVPGAGR